MPKKHLPIVLTILDGWGYREEHDDNAIAQANTPHWDHWWQHFPHMLLDCSGPAVGLPKGQIGNSEVGHMHLGAGRVIDQDLTHINKAISDGDFATNPILLNAIQQAKTTNRRIHILGLLSPGGVHSHEKHIHALIELIAEHDRPDTYIHAFLDGRDTPPRSAKESLKKLSQLTQLINCGQIASISGRYYAMDRDKRWDRIERVYNLLTTATTDFHSDDPIQALEQAYERNENDEFVQPTLIKNASPIQEGDIIIFMNFRADRARQLSYAFLTEDFSGFQRKNKPKLAEFVTLTEYASNIKSEIAFPPELLINTLGEYIAEQGLKQLRIAETEKYAHVTFFFNGGREDPFDNEDRVLIASPQVATYDLQPEMSAPELTERLIAAIKSKQYALIICNYANADMVGHTGNIVATRKAVECLDHCLGEVYASVKSVGGEMLITADHGNAEYMFNETIQQAHTAHTADPVPLIYLGRDAEIKKHGCLIDVAPTILSLMNLTPPQEMTGESLLTIKN